MTYDDLRKLFFMDKNTHEAVYQRRVTNECAVHLSIHIHEFPVFFLITPEVLQLCMEILRLNQEIPKLRELLPEKAFEQYRNTCLISEITLTNDIENVHSSRREISDLLNDLKQRDNRKRFHGLVNKYAMLLQNDTRKLATCQDIRDIFDEMVANEIQMDSPENLPDGKYFRAESVTVYSGTGKALHQGLCPESLIIEVMEQALLFLNDSSIDILLRISVFHYLFGYIHPFYDGNGRVSRFISSYLLSGTLDPIVAFHLSLTIKNQLSAYYKAFEICNDSRNKGDLTPFILMFLTIIRDSINELRTDLSTKIAEFLYYLKLAKASFSSTLSANQKTFSLCSLLIQAALFSEDGIPTADLLDMLTISRTTLASCFKELPENLYHTKKIKNAKYYQMNLAALEHYANLNQAQS